MPMPNAAMLTDSDRVGQSVYVARKMYNPNVDFQLHFWSCPEDGERYSIGTEQKSKYRFTRHKYICVSTFPCLRPPNNYPSSGPLNGKVEILMFLASFVFALHNPHARRIVVWSGTTGDCASRPPPTVRFSFLFRFITFWKRTQCQPCTLSYSAANATIIIIYTE